jgi:hypothetical protein
VRLEGSCRLVSWRSPRGIAYIYHYRRRDGVRVGGGHHAQLVQPETAQTVPTNDERQRLRRVDALYREWTRNRADVNTLGGLQDAIQEALESSTERV